MRAWIILFETIISIIILTAAYLMFLNYSRNVEERFKIEPTLNIENLRVLIEKCDQSKVYVIYNVSSNEYKICINGNYGNLDDISNYTYYKKYFFSGYKTYDPFILILYQ